MNSAALRLLIGSCCLNTALSEMVRKAFVVFGVCGIPYVVD